MWKGRLMGAGVIAAVILVSSCSKSEPEQATPEQAAGQAPTDTNSAHPATAQDTTAATRGAYGDTTAASTGAYPSDSSAPADSVRPDST